MPALRRGSLVGMAEVLRRLGVDAPHVLFGHTHRAGPWPGDDPSEWTTAAGGRLTNTGSWVHQPHFLTGRPGASPYWPGIAVRVDATGPPRLLRLLGDRDRKWLGYFRNADQQGRLVAQGQLDQRLNIADYRRLLITKETAEPPGRPGTTYLAGTVDTGAAQRSGGGSTTGSTGSSGSG